MLKKHIFILTVTIGIFCSGLFIFIQFSRPPTSHIILPDTKILQIGDWVLRGGISKESLIIKEMSKSQYSHIGMIVALDPEVLIAHATTDDNPKLPNQVLLTPLKDFFADDKANTITIVRANFLTQQQREQSAKLAKNMQGRKFILSEKQENPFYCTLLISNAIQPIYPLFSPQWQYVDMAIFRGEYLFPEGFLHQDIQYIYQYTANE